MCVCVCVCVCVHACVHVCVRPCVRVSFCVPSSSSSSFPFKPAFLLHFSAFCSVSLAYFVLLDFISFVSFLLRELKRNRGGGGGG